MKDLCLLLLAGTIAGYLLYADFRREIRMDRKIKTLTERVDALQLAASARIEVPEYDGTKTIRPKVIKY